MGWADGRGTEEHAEWTSQVDGLSARVRQGRRLRPEPRHWVVAQAPWHPVTARLLQDWTRQGIQVGRTVTRVSDGATTKENRKKAAEATAGAAGSENAASTEAEGTAAG